MRKLAKAAVVLLLLAAAVPALAEAANEQTFEDSRGESCCVGDISRVTVSNDDAGTVRLAISIPVRPTSDDLLVRLNSDRDVTTGDREGFDYAITWYGADEPIFSRWDDGGWFEYRRGDPVRVSDDGRVTTLVFDRRAVGDTDGFDFALATINAGTMHAFVDDAPDGGGVWSFDVRLEHTVLQPTLAYRPAPARAGGMLTAALSLRVAGTDKLLASGTITCVARAGRSRLVLHRKAFLRRRVVCVWRIPPGARGARVTAAVTLQISRRPAFSVTRRVRVRVL